MTNPYLKAGFPDFGRPCFWLSIHKRESTKARCFEYADSEVHQLLEHLKAIGMGVVIASRCSSEEVEVALCIIDICYRKKGGTDMNLTVSFSGRKGGNCDRIAKYISAEDDLVFFMREISTQPCAGCDYECMSGRCRYRGDGIYSFFDKLSTVDRIFYIVPMYCGNPSALYFILNERCQDYFLHNESRYKEIVEKLYIIGVYGSSEDSPDFLDFFARQYDFPNPGKHILGLERHRYHQKMGDFLLEVEDVRARLDAFTGRQQT